MCPDWELNQRPFGSQVGAQSTKLQQPGLYLKFFKNLFLILFGVCWYIWMHRLMFFHQFWEVCDHYFFVGLFMFIFIPFSPSMHTQGFLDQRQISFFFLDFIYLFLERGERRKRGRETSKFGCLLCAPYWGLACNPGMYPDWELNWLPFGSQAGTESTEPHQLGPDFLLSTT